MKNTRFALIGLAFLALACDKNGEDTTSPNINALNVDAEYVAAGQTLIVTADVSDESGLSQIKLDIHDQFDGHNHGKIAGIPWEEVRVIDIDGKEYFITENFDVPDNATAGPYHVIAQVVDAAGNTGEFREVDFWVTNSEMPMINLVNPDLSFEPYYAIGDTLNFIGTITDDEELEEIVVKIVGFAGDVYYDEDIDLGGQGVTTFDLSTLPALIFDLNDFGPNHVVMEFEITAIDHDGNINAVTNTLHYN